MAVWGKGQEPRGALEVDGAARSRLLDVRREMHWNRVIIVPKRYPHLKPGTCDSSSKAKKDFAEVIKLQILS